MVRNNASPALKEAVKQEKQIRICYDCNSRNPWDAESCRRCRGDLRRKVQDLQANR